MSTPVSGGVPYATQGGGSAARAVSLVKTYGTGEAQVVALDGVDVSIGRGQFTAVMGPSGSGKSTLMHRLAGLDTVSAGRVWLGDREITGLDDRRLTRLRRDHVGFVFQAFNLLPTLTAEENITLPMDIAGRKPDREWLREVIDTLRLGDRLRHRPAQLSGGQQQRVACARALAARPALIFADEPTGNLDSRSGLEVLQFLREAVDGLGQTVVMVTHDPNAAAHADLALYLADGRIVDEMPRPSAASVLARMQVLTADPGPAASPPAPPTTPPPPALPLPPTTPPPPTTRPPAPTTTQAARSKTTDP
ncbi:ABC transporter ATP-binding protein [Streptomyces sp. NPDC052496]|uniref:ABC transporter ATP-binding protein n=1 Tax=Streptomyces sp. NPDC052496 TaxID=3154951 RepID=UPI003449D780